jgi:hypothetical protein
VFVRGPSVKPLGIGQEIGVGLMGDNPRLGKLSGNVEFCDQYARDRGSAELKPSDASWFISS